MPTNEYKSWVKKLDMELRKRFGTDVHDYTQGAIDYCYQERLDTPAKAARWLNDA